MSRAKTLVTGATGMTGSHTVQLLLKRGHTVRVIAHGEDERSMRLQELGAEETNHDRRSFLRTAAMTIAAAKVGRLRSADAQSPKAKPAGVPTIKPGANTSFNLRRFLHEY